MTKQRASAETIQAAMQQWIEQGSDENALCRQCEAPLPLPLAGPQNGCNWTVGYSKVLPGCATFMLEIIERAKRDYDLI